MRGPPYSTRTDTLCPTPALFGCRRRGKCPGGEEAAVAGPGDRLDPFAHPGERQSMLADDVASAQGEVTRVRPALPGGLAQCQGGAGRHVLLVHVMRLDDVAVPFA